MSENPADFPCPCCGFLAFEEPPGSFEICGICFWEDDAVQLEYATTLAGGANKVTLRDAQVNFVKYGAGEPEMVKHARKPGLSDKRDPHWRPIDLRIDTFETWGDPGRRRPSVRAENLYYWRPTFWRLGS